MLKKEAGPLPPKKVLIILAKGAEHNSELCWPGNSSGGSTHKILRTRNSSATHSVSESVLRMLPYELSESCLSTRSSKLTASLNSLSSCS